MWQWYGEAALPPHPLSIVSLPRDQSMAGRGKGPSPAQAKNAPLNNVYLKKARVHALTDWPGAVSLPHNLPSFQCINKPGASQVLVQNEDRER